MDLAVTLSLCSRLGNVPRASVAAKARLRGCRLLTLRLRPAGNDEFPLPKAVDPFLSAWLGA
jgi:hypothetical protein